MDFSVWNRFPHKAALFYSGYRDRVAGFKKELARVGVDGYTPFWGCTNPYERVLEARVPHKRGCVGGYFNTSLKHHAVVKTAYELGAENVLVFEDDVRFLKDVGPVLAAVESLPDDYDAALFEWTPMPVAGTPEIAMEIGAIRSGRVNDHWHRARRFYSMAAYAVSRRMMERLIDCYERPAHGAAKLRICDHYWCRILESDPNLNAYVSSGNVCIQACPQGNTPMQNMRAKYDEMGVDRGEYAPW